MRLKGQVHLRTLHRIQLQVILEALLNRITVIIYKQQHRSEFVFVRLTF